MIGIYKITSPTKNIYIGQSINIEQRFKDYKRLHCKEQHRLYNSLKKHGVSKHKFEILEQCDVHLLNEKERYYQDLFSVINKNGMNLVLTKTSDRSGVLTKNVRDKISLSKKGKKRKPFSDEWKKNMGIARKGKKGVPRTQEWKKRISDSKKGIKVNPNVIKMLAILNSTPVYQFDLKGILIKKHESLIVASKEVNISASCICNCLAGRQNITAGFLWSKTNTVVIKEKRDGKKIINTLNGDIYTSIKKASESENIPYTILWNRLNGLSKTYTHLQYL